MQLYFSDQRSYFAHHLEQLKTVPVAAYDSSRLNEKETVFAIETDVSFHEADGSFLWDYRIFPEHILVALPQWQQEGRAIQPGDTVVQQAYLPPLGSFSLKFVFGVRIREVIREPWRIGFSYETLEGHAELGISTFTLEEREGKTVFVIHTFSQPGNSLTRLLGPLFTTPYQRFCTKAAGRRVAHQLSLIK